MIITAMANLILNSLFFIIPSVNIVIPDALSNTLEYFFDFIFGAFGLIFYFVDAGVLFACLGLWVAVTNITHIIRIFMWIWEKIPVVGH